MGQRPAVRGKMRAILSETLLYELMTATEQTYRTWMCLICGWIYDEAAGAPEEGIAPGTRWEDVPMNWTCPECGARKDDFEMVEV
jgi:rubredoxin